MPSDNTPDRARSEAFTTWWNASRSDLTIVVRHHLSRQFGATGYALQKTEDVLQCVGLWLLRSEPLVFAAVLASPPNPPPLVLSQAINRVVRSTASDYHTRRTADGRRERRHDCSLEHDVPTKDSVVDAVLFDESHARCLKALETLPENERYVFVEVHLKARTLMEVAGELGMGKSAAYQAMQRAVAVVKSVMKGQ